MHDQCITLEQSKKLDELGFERKCERYNSEELLFQYGRNGKWDGYRCEDYDIDEAYPAYTVSELMEYLPYQSQDGNYKLEIIKGEELYYVYYSKLNGEEYSIEKSNKNLTQALGDMLIHLLSNKYM